MPSRRSASSRVRLNDTTITSAALGTGGAVELVSCVVTDEDEQSQAIDHCCTCGMGWTEARMSYLRDPAGLKAAQFVDRRDPTWTVVLHPSTKRTGWQVSRFDQHGAVGDTIRPTCSEALEAADITPYRWKLVEVVR